MRICLGSPFLASERWVAGWGGVSLGSPGALEGLLGDPSLLTVSILWMPDTESSPAPSEVHMQGKCSLGLAELDELAASRGKGSLSGLQGVLPAPNLLAES